MTEMSVSILNWLKHGGRDGMDDGSGKPGEMLGLGSEFGSQILSRQLCDSSFVGKRIQNRF